MDEKRQTWILMNKLRFITFIILLYSSTLNAQNNQLYFEQLTTADGLSANTVISICQDSFGFLWFGTYSGLNRYDGYTIKKYTYNRNDPNSISHNVIEDSLVDKNGVLWFATGEGLCRFDYKQEKFIRYYHVPNNDKSLGHNKLRSLYEDRKGNFWIGTDGGGLDLMDRSKDEFRHFKHDPNDRESISNNTISQIYEDRHENLWIATDGGLNLFNREAEKFKYYQNDENNLRSLSHDNVTCILEDQHGDLWIGTWGGGLNRLKEGYQDRLNEPNFIRYDPKNSSLGNNIIHDIMEDRSGSFWIATRGGGINRYDRKNDRFIRYTHDFCKPHSLSNNMVVDLFEDRSGIFWAGTYGGVNKYDPSLRKFDLFQVNPCKKKTYIFQGIYSLFVDSTNKQGDIVWLGSQCEGLSQWDRINDEYKPYKPETEDPCSFPSGFIPAILKDLSGRLWLGTGDGLSRFDEEKGIFYNYFHDSNDPNSLSDKDVYSLFEDKDNQLWIGTYRGGLNLLDVNNPENLNPKKADFDHFFNDPNDSTSISDMTIREIYQDSNGILWFGTERGGLNRYDSANERFIRMLSVPKDANTLSDNYVRCIYEAHDGVLWIGTANGLNKLKPIEKMETEPLFIHYTKENGLASNSIHDILEDADGYLWISTNRGISKFNPATGKFNNYGPEDGLQSEEFADNACAIGNSGYMYFGGSDGLNIFDPNGIKNTPFVPPVVITDFKISGKSVPIGQMDDGRVILSQSIVKTNKIELSYKDDVISFEFAGLHYGSPENNQYAYFMEGFDKDWINAGTNRKITYTNLNHGKYKFRIKASNNDGVWNEEGKTLEIRIKPPFYKTWWFMMLYFSFIVVVIFVVAPFCTIFYWHHRIESHKKESKRTAGRIAHELGTPISEVGFSLHALHKTLPGKFSHHLFAIDNAVERVKAIMQAMGEIGILEELIKSGLDISSFEELEVVSVNKLLQTAIMAVKETRDEDVKFSIEYSSNTDIRCNPNEIIQVFINILRNSYDAILADKKGKEEGKISVKSANMDDTIQVTIQDDGEGISKDIEKLIFKEKFSTRGGVGRGFGLTVAKDLVKKNKGKLEIKNIIKNEEISGCIATMEFPKGRKNSK